MSPKKRRLWYVTLIVLFVGGAALIVLTTLTNHLLFFMTPTEALEKKPTTPIRLGGLVEVGSLQRHKEMLKMTFRVTDGQNAISVKHQGVVPDLFREGQGVVAEGTLSQDGTFHATRLLAKHDETYMPREVADALKAKGQQRSQETSS